MSGIKAIQSFVNFGTPNSTFPLNKDYAYIAKLSSLLLKEHYGEVTLYTNKYHKSAFELMNFPYEYDTNVLSKEKAKIFSEVKLQAFAAQDKPYIHFDLDTIVGTKLDIYSKTSPFIFSHPDKNRIGFRKDGKIKGGKKHKVLHSFLNDRWFHDIFSTYFKYLWTLKLPKDWPTHLIFPELIPNMNIVGVKDPTTFNKAVEKALWIANNNRDKLTDWESACFIEQLVIPLYLSFISPEYREAQKAHKNKIGIDSFLLANYELNEVPSINLKGDYDESIYHTTPLKFPYKYINNYSCSECSDFHKREYEINSDEDLVKILDLKDYKLTHIGGFNKSVIIYQVMVLYTLKKYFGDDAILDVTKAYLGKRKKARLSPGEAEYERLTGDYLFTDFYGFPRKKLLL